MELYEIKVEKSPSGNYGVECPAFNIPGYTAENPRKAVMYMKEAVEKKGAELLKDGEPLPEEAIYKEGTYLLGFDIKGRFRKDADEIVRRTVSLPKWMDIMIRNSEIDSSGVFRNAVMNALKPAEYNSDITSIEELEGQVSPAILKKYVEKCVAESIEEAFKGKEKKS